MPSRRSARYQESGPEEERGHADPAGDSKSAEHPEAPRFPAMDAGRLPKKRGLPFAGIAAAAAVASIAAAIAVVLSLAGGGDDWALDGDGVEEKFAAYIDAGRLGRAAEGLDLVRRREEDSVRCQRMTLKLASALLEKKSYKEAYGLAAGLPLVDKSEEVAAAILRVKFAALRPAMFTQEGDLLAPFNLGMHRDMGGYILAANESSPRDWGTEGEGLAERFIEDLEDAKAMMKGSGRAEAEFGPLVALAEVVRWAYDLVGEEEFLRDFGDPSLRDLPVRYQFANLLFRQQRHEEAVPMLKAIIEQFPGTPEADRAFRHVARFVKAREIAAKAVPLWEIDFGNFIEKCLEVARYAEIFRAAGEEVRAELSGKAGIAGLKRMNDDEPRDVFESEKGGKIDTDLPPVEDDGIPAECRRVWKEFNLKSGTEESGGKLFIQTDFNSFRLVNESSRPFHSGSAGGLKLVTKYRGVIRFSLYRFAGYEAFMKFDESSPEKGLGGASKVAVWSMRSGQSCRNGNEEAETAVLPRVGPGYYAAIAEARYCPVIAGAKLIVSDLMLAVRAGRTSLVAFVTDRLTGTPVKSVGLKAAISDSYDLDRIGAALLGRNPDQDYKAGLALGFKAPCAAGSEDLRRAGPEFRKGAADGAELRKTYPALSLVLSASTGPDGTAVFDVPEALHAHAYRISVESSDPGMCFWCSLDSIHDRHEKMLKCLFYTDRPVYRPGDEVNFKGLIRVFDGENYFLPGASPLKVEIRHSGGTVFSALMLPDEAGTVHGSFVLPVSAAMGAYTAFAGDGKESGIFKVMQFTKPEIDVSVDPGMTILAAGEHISARIQATTPSGEPIPGEKINVKICRQPLDFEHDAAYRISGSPRVSGAGRGRVVFTKECVSGPEGEIMVDFKTDPDFDAAYSVSAFTVDRPIPVEAMSVVEARAMPVRVSVTTDRLSYRQGDVLKASVTTLDLEARPVSWKLRIREIANKKDPGAFEPQSKEYSTGQDGRAQIEFTVRKGCGGLVLGAWFKGEWRDRDLPVEVDGAGPAEAKKTVAVARQVCLPGDGVGVNVLASKESTHALICVETDRILAHRVVALDDGCGSLNLVVPAEWSPNFFVSATYVFDDKTAQGASESVKVIPVHRFLRLEIKTDKREYKPGETCNAIVKVSDFDGKPRPGASVSVGAVDEALFRICSDNVPDLREFFHSYALEHRISSGWFDRSFRFPSFGIWKIPVFAVEEPFDKYISIDGGAGGAFGGRFGGKRNLSAYGGGAAHIRTPARKAFRDTAFWEADLKSDADGLIRISFAMPDNIGAFRFTARGLTADTKVGEVRDEVAVRKNFYAMVKGPELLRRGDKAEVKVIVRNRAPGAVSARLRFHSPFPICAGGRAEEEFDAPPGGEKVFRFVVDLRNPPDNDAVPGSAESGADDLHLCWDERAAVFRADVASKDGAESDSVLARFPFAGSGVILRSGLSGVIPAGGGKRKVSIGLGAGAEASRIMIGMSASVPGAVLDTVDAIADPGQGCVEQTAESVLCSAAAASMLGASGSGGDAAIACRKAGMQGLSGLARMRLSTGEWGWICRKDESSAFMTALALAAMAHAAKAGFEVNREHMDKAADALVQVLSAPGDRPGRSARAFGSMNARVFAAFALSSARSCAGIEKGGLVKYLVSRENPVHMTDLDCAAMGFVLAAEGMPSAAEAELSVFAGPASDPARMDVKTLSFLLMAWEKLGRPAKDRSALAMEILARRTGRGWKTPVDSALAVLALAAFAQSGDSGAGLSSATVSFGGREIGRLGKERTRMLAEVGPGPLKGAASAEFEVESSGEAPLFWSAWSESAMPAAGAPVDHGIRVQTKIYAPAFDGRLAPSKPGAPVPAAGAVWVRLDLAAAESQEYVMVVQPLPTGFRPGYDVSGDRPSRAESMDLRLARMEIQPGEIDLRKIDARLSAAENAVVCGRAGEAAGMILSLCRSAADESAWALRSVESCERIELADVHRVEARREALVFFIGALDPGVKSLVFRLSTAFPCEVALPPAWAAPLYRPEVFGRSTALGIGGSTEPAAGEHAGQVPAWEDRAWVAAMLDASGTLVDDGRAASMAASLRRGCRIESVLARELLARGGGNDVDLAFGGFRYRLRPSADGRLDLPLAAEVERRRRLFSEFVSDSRGLPSAGVSAALLEKILADTSLYDALESAGGAGLGSLKPSALWEAVKFERELKMEAASLAAASGRSPARGAAPSFRMAAGMLLLSSARPAEERKGEYLEWTLADPGLAACGMHRTLGDLARFVSDDLKVPVETQALVPGAMLDIETTFRRELGFAPPSPGHSSFGAYLRDVFRKVELGVEVKEGKSGLVIVPLAKLVGFDDDTAKRRLEAVLAEWKETKGK